MLGDILEATFFTITDEQYFLGTVALLNSLRIAGNHGPLVVLDMGLSRAQRLRLSAHARVVSIQMGHTRRPWMLKTFPRFFDPNGVAIIIDSDMIVTRSLKYVVDHAAAGRIVRTQITLRIGTDRSLNGKASSR